MGCLKLTYREEPPTLRVVKSIFFSEEKTGAGLYRYGFQGQERDDEVKGEGNSYDFGARMYDSRLGRFLSLDPMKKRYPYMAPYVFAADNPIVFIDYEGLGPIIVIQSKVKSSTIKSLLGSASGESIKKK